LEKVFVLGDPDPDVLHSLAGYYRNDGDEERARGLMHRARLKGYPQDFLDSLERKRRPDTEPFPWAGPQDEGNGPRPPADDEVFRFMQTFSGREGIYARQWWNPKERKGGYTPVREPMSFRVVRDHLVGAVTAGAYVVRLDGTVRFMAFDIDMTKRAMEAVSGDPGRAKSLRTGVLHVTRSIRHRLGKMGMKALEEDSGYKGRHLWVLFEKPVDAHIVHRFGRSFLAGFPCTDPRVHVEFFPKQARTSGGPGNLIKLPLGLHKRVGRWSRLIGPDGKPSPKPHEFLRTWPRINPDILVSAMAQIPPAQAKPTAESSKTEQNPDRSKVERNDDLPPPLMPGPAWTEADFERDRKVAHLFSRCAVLENLRKKVLECRCLDYDEQMVLRHTLGHIDSGALAVNWLLGKCENVPEEVFLKSNLSGNPMSCSRIRKRVLSVVSEAGCDCVFGDEEESYPHPLLHLSSLPIESAQSAQEEPAAIDEQAGRLGALLRRAKDLAGEIGSVRTALIETMLALGADRIALENGEFALRQRKGEVPSLVWRPLAKMKPMEKRKRIRLA
jgi:hypothetical protein